MGRLAGFADVEERLALLSKVATSSSGLRSWSALSSSAPGRHAERSIPSLAGSAPLRECRR